MKRIILLAIAVILFSCSKDKNEQIINVENIEDNTVFYSRGLLFNWELIENKGFMPSSILYLIPKLKYNTLAIWEINMDEKNKENIIDAFPYNKEQFIVLYKYDEDGKVLCRVESTPYEDLLIESLYKYDKYGRKIEVHDRNFRKQLKSHVDIMTYDDINNSVEEESSFKLSHIIEYSPVNKDFDVLEYHIMTADEKRLIASYKEGKTEDYFFNNYKKVWLNDDKTIKKLQEDYSDKIWTFFYNEDGTMKEIINSRENSLEYPWKKFYDAKYFDGKLLMSKYYDAYTKKVIKYVYTKHDLFGNWLEAEIYKNESGKLSSKIIRYITYY
ncbi:hypothetical protein [Treponema pedis]|uniref:hypothetical protein n=2 Tax=Treponema pedis TaxID=409322 RepID=UPI000421675A|nr:hypothetical protein [Treponema pedis]